MAHWISKISSVLSVALVGTIVSTPSWAGGWMICVEKPCQAGMICDADRCRSRILEAHQDTAGMVEQEDSNWRAPPGITLDTRAGHYGTVEIEGGGATHYVNISWINPDGFRCRWHAQKKHFGDNGLTKGYCWADIKK